MRLQREIAQRAAPALGRARALAAIKLLGMRTAFHYNPAGNHLFAYALKDRVVDWLDPKPLPYRDTPQKMINFQGYLQE